MSQITSLTCTRCGGHNFITFCVKCDGDLLAAKDAEIKRLREVLELTAPSKLLMVNNP